MMDRVPGGCDVVDADMIERGLRRTLAQQHDRDRHSEIAQRTPVEALRAQ